MLNGEATRFDQTIARIREFRNRGDFRNSEMRASLIQAGNVLNQEKTIQFKRIFPVRSFRERPAGGGKLRTRRRRLMTYSGTLSRSVRYELSQKRDEVKLTFGSFGVPYARYHEFGYRSYRGNPFIQPTVKRAQQRVIAFIREALTGGDRK